MTYPPQQPSYGQPYGYPQPPPPPRKKAPKWPWVVGGIVVALVVGCVGAATAVGMWGRHTVDTLADNATGKNVVVGEMGKPVRDSFLEFTVLKMACGQTEVGDETLGATAEGQYCLVDVRVRNFSDKRQIFSEYSHRAWDTDGNPYTNDPRAEMALNGGPTKWSGGIEPGNQISGQLAYDVPEGARLAAIEMHAELLSGGVKVPLTS